MTTKYYAVNDRPVQIVETPEGGNDCLVFDYASGNLVPNREYFTYVVSGSGKDVDALDAAGFERLINQRRVDVIRLWVDRLATLASGSVEDLAKAIQVAGEVTTKSGFTTIEPAPLGAKKLMLIGGELGMAHLDLRPADGAVTRAMLYARLGTGRSMPRVSAKHPHQLAWDAPRVTVFAQFARTPVDTTPATAIILRTGKAR